MEASSTLTDALLAAGTVAIFFCVTLLGLYRVVTWARRRSKRAYVIAAALAPIMALGMVVDPDMRIVQEAKRLKKREEDNPGDPPESEDEGVVRAATEIASRKKENTMRKNEVAFTAKPMRPVLASVIAVVLGLIAVLNALLLAWLLLADAALLAPRARLVRDSLSAFDWGSLFLLSAILLTSMVMLFRLRKVSLYFFGVYVTLGVLGSLWYALTPEHELYFDVRVTSFGGIPVALGVLLYMLRLKKRAVFA